MSNEEITRRCKALFIAGQMLSCEMLKDHDPEKQKDWERLAPELDIEILEKFLENPTKDFLYADHIRNTIKMVKERRQQP